MSIQVGGLISGLDTNRLVSQLTEIEKLPVRELQTRRHVMHQALKRISSLIPAILQRCTGCNGEPVRADIRRISVVDEQAVTMDMAEGASHEQVWDPISQRGTPRQRTHNQRRDGNYPARQPSACRPDCRGRFASPPALPLKPCP